MQVDSGCVKPSGPCFVSCIDLCFLTWVLTLVLLLLPDVGVCSAFAGLTMISLHLHRPPVASAALPLYLLRCSPSRIQHFSVRVSFIHQRRVAACFSAIEGGNPREWNDDKICKKEFSRKGWRNLFNSRNTEFEALKEASKQDEQPLKIFIQVVAGLLGAAFLLSKMGGVDARTVFVSAQTLPLWFMGTSKRCLPQAMPLYIGQFGAITSALNNPSSMFNLTMPNLGFINEGVPRLSYIFDILLERQPISYILLLMTVCCTLIFIGGVLFSNFRSYQQNPGDSFWDAWACLCSSETHLEEKTVLERGIGLMLAVGGLLFYSLLTSTMTAQFESRMEWLREGAHSEVMEQGHVVICGTNSHLTTVLKQLNKSQQLALHDGLTRKRKQTVLLLSENERKVTEKLLSNELKNLLQLNILTRSGSLSNTASFLKVAADKAHSIIVLASDKNKYEADAESVLTVLALQPLLNRSGGKLVVEVFNASTSELLRSSTGLKLNTMQNLSSKLLVQCSRQPGLVDVYQELLEHDRQVINIRTFPTLTGITYQELRRGFPEAVVCGLLQDGKIQFHPPDQLLLKASDKVLMICAKDCYKNAPKNLTAPSNVEGVLSMKAASYETSLLPAHTSSTQSDAKQASKAAEWRAGPRERILILGWDPRVSEMITEYDDYVGPGTELIILAETSKEEREHILSRKIRKPLQNVCVNHQVGNPMSRTDVGSAILHPSPKSKSGCSVRKHKAPDNTNMPLSILVLADSTWKVGDKSGPDKQSVLALLLAEDVCKKLAVEVNSLVAEFVDAELGKQVMNLRPNLKTIGTDEIVGLVTAQVAEQSELGDVWTDLLNPSGDEIYMKDIKGYIKVGEIATFAELSEQAVLRNEVAIGYTMGNQTVINPPSKDVPLSFSQNDVLVVICEFQYS